ncbi:arylamine N-acetyltransferase family protein [Fodinibius salsisoli]|uniref:Arylamine N-acetyltransferase n=1 Tax=Fodinibius salsisoli TaxID=2820877 RepID=A0ABT3PHV9_9BACT|nr:arylamine N-acetyltransferase [Fodinibius salsisoli]MCW9705506.1 arylamine N-acetyltransferase [Fodinibius salsisoli]
MMSAINLDNYFERIGYEGTPTPTLDTLRILHEKHTEAIPFENLNPLLALPVKLDLQSLEDKMIQNQRGGYCFEQNLLFRNVLQQIGFEVKGLAARVRWNKSEEEMTPRGHMLLLVQVEGRSYIADVGFGGSTLSAPMLLEPDMVQQTPHEPYRLVQKEEEYLLQIQIKEEWKALYQFGLQEHYQPDYELTSWYLSHHPESHFVNDLIAARTAPGRRYVLSGNTFKIHHLEGPTEEQTLETANELRIVLENEFKLALPNVEKLRSTLKQKTGHQETVL